MLKMEVIMYRLSRYWNRVAYLILRIGQKMIWDYTGKNKDLLTKDEICTQYAEDIMCDK